MRISRIPTPYQDGWNHQNSKVSAMRYSGAYRQDQALFSRADVVIVVVDLQGSAQAVPS
jgi:hypothetical protein